jgi:hypothetical protein
VINNEKPEVLHYRVEIYEKDAKYGLLFSVAGNRVSDTGPVFKSRKDAEAGANLAMETISSFLNACMGQAVQETIVRWDLVAPDEEGKDKP